MTTRILITDATGFPLAMLDGHHGAQHAQEWTRAMLAQLAQSGIADPMVFELTPSEGGDAFRADVLQQLGRIRPEFRTRPDGQREVIGFHRIEPVGRQFVASPQKVAAMAPAASVRCAHRLVQAPANVHGDRQPIRIPRGRQNSTAPLSATDRRHLRRAARAAKRSPA